jgi:hypothetical protein
MLREECGASEVKSSEAKMEVEEESKNAVVRYSMTQ